MSALSVPATSDVARISQPRCTLRSGVAALIVLLLAVGLVSGVSPNQAAAYESEVTSSPVGLPCSSCHGGSSAASGTVDASRKGPHGGYTTGTSKCESCHFLHDAPTDASLLPAQTIRATCEMCHDGTGGTGVYGTIRARTGRDPKAAHRIDAARTVPSGSPSGDVEMTFSGEGGQLTCVDCHSPHDNDTVQPFVGDRIRSTGDTNTVPTNRLLKRRPGGTPVAVDVYGSSWCGGCHGGSVVAVHGPGRMGNHPVATETAGFSYNNVVRLAGVDTTATEWGPLGGSNAGYLMPVPRVAEQDGHAPLCQQCHEDARHVGDDPAEPYTLQPEEVFSVTAPDGTESTDTPRFQVFPHEGENPRFRLELGDDLCLNCHPR